MGREINSHKDVEDMINRWGVRSQDNFNISLHKDFFSENWHYYGTSPPSDGTDVHRFLEVEGPDEHEFNHYGEVDQNGKIKLTVRIGRHIQKSPADGSWIFEIVRRYKALKDNLEREGVEYEPDNDFEEAIIKSASCITGRG